MHKIRNYLSLVKFSHTIFAMPFALLGFTMGLGEESHDFSLKILILIILCMVFARNAAMSFNRYVDRFIDSKNPRTSEREIPAGIISAGNVLAFIIINSVLFIAAAGLINKMTFILSPVALAIIMGYSYTKRFTAYSHLVLGLGLGLAPVGAYLSVCGEFHIAPLMVGFIVLTWVAGFDIIYSLQDVGFDKENKLHSIPNQYGPGKAVLISSLLHFLSVSLALATGIYMNYGILYFTGTAVFAALLIWEHILAGAGDSESINKAFGTVNSYAGVIFVAFAICDLLLL